MASHCRCLQSTHRTELRVSGSERKELAACWRKQESEHLQNVYSVLSSVEAIKEIRIRWAANVARIGYESYTNVL
jgi:hypothetical protein